MGQKMLKQITSELDKVLYSWATAVNGAKWTLVTCDVLEQYTKVMEIKS